MQRLIFEYSPALILVSIGLGVGYAWILYRSKHAWSKLTNQILFTFRALTVALLSFLLIGPILKLTTNEMEKPTWVFLVDNSLSMKEVLDSALRNDLLNRLQSQSEVLKEDNYEVEIRALDGSGDFSFNEPISDLHQSIRNVLADYEGKNLAGIALASDGIYNSGPSPLYSPLRIPVYTIGLGDTTERIDLALKNIVYNKIAYQGNRFPLRAEVLIRGISNQEIKVSVYQGNNQIASQSKNSGNKNLLDFDFQLDATATGIQRIDVVVESIPQEANRKNNRASAFIEVVEGKKKILVVAPAPHPDVKATRTAIEKNSNYELIVHIPGIKEAAPSELQPEKTDLAIFFQAFDREGKTAALLQRFLKSRSGILLTSGSRSNLAQMEANGIPVHFENTGQKDEVTPLINSTFRDFTFSDGLSGIFAGFPPVTVPFGKFTPPPNATVLLYQKIGSVATNRPLLFNWSDAERKVAVLLGEGIWKWRLNEFAETEKTEAFDEVFSKLIQYLSTQDDKRKFRSFPIQNEFSDSEPVVFESQVYNELFEPVYGHTIQLEIRDESGKTVPYSYATSPSGSRYRIGGLKEGIYKYRSSTEVNGKQEEVRGEFLVTAQNLESQNLTADFGLLRKLSINTGGKFYRPDQIASLSTDLAKQEARSLIHSEDTFHPIINLKAVFFLLLFLISVEWFARKYLGAY